MDSTPAVSGRISGMPVRHISTLTTVPVQLICTIMYYLLFRLKLSKTIIDMNIVEEWALGIVECCCDMLVFRKLSGREIILTRVIKISPVMVVECSKLAFCAIKRAEYVTCSDATQCSTQLQCEEHDLALIHAAWMPRCRTCDRVFSLSGEGIFSRHWYWIHWMVQNWMLCFWLFAAHSTWHHFFLWDIYIYIYI